MEYIEKLEQIVGSDNLTASRVDCLSYSRDMSVHVGVPDIVVFPENKEQVIEIVKVAASHKVPLIPRGSGTSVQEINQLLAQFRQMQRMMKQLGGGKGQRALAKMLGGGFR